MATPDDKVDFARAKPTFDKLYDPASTDIDASLKQIDNIVQAVRAMAGPSATPQQRLIALRTYIYKAGPWNENNPFTYDFADPLGRKTSNQLLATLSRLDFLARNASAALDHAYALGWRHTGNAQKEALAKAAAASTSPQR